MLEATRNRGADALVQSILRAGVDTIFSLSGNHIMPVYDALIDTDIRLIHTRHEAAAVHMADAWGRLTGHVGVALVTGGPGHANAVSALYTAYMSESPMILLSGHSPQSMAGWGAFQEMDQVAMSRPVVKSARMVTSANSIAGDFAEACRIAHSGRPGPVHLSLPTDVLEAGLACGFELPNAEAYFPLPQDLQHSAAVQVMQRLKQAERPLILVGPQGCTADGRRAVAKLQAATAIPVIATESPRGHNDPSLGAFSSLLADSDLVLLVGKRIDFTLGFARPPVFAPSCCFIQIDSDTIEFERSRRAVGSRLEACHQADTLPSLDALALTDCGAPAHEQWLRRVLYYTTFRPENWKRDGVDIDHASHANHVTGWLEEKGSGSAQGSGSVHETAVAGLTPVALFRKLQVLLDGDPDAVLVIDGGEIGQWAQACLYAPNRLINGSAGAIGPALPMAIAARLAKPQSLVVAVMGDGTFGFHCSEFDTANRYDAPFICVVGNDARWNAEYQIQVRDYGETRTYGCELQHSRYDQVAAAFGGHGENVDNHAELAEALERAARSGRPACVNVMLAGRPAPLIRIPET